MSPHSHPHVFINAALIHDWPSFHEAFAAACGFPNFYGRNMNAWVDCMTCADDPDAGMVKLRVHPGEVLLLVIQNAEEFKRRCPEQFLALEDCAAFVNRRRLESGGKPVVALQYQG